MKTLIMAVFKKILFNLFFIFSVSAAIGQSFIEKSTPPQADRNGRDEFGQVVAISGDYTLIGTSQEDDDENNQDSLRSTGGAYIYKKDTAEKWKYKQKIVASDRATDDFFATSLCIQGDFAFIGAIGQDEDTAGNNVKTDAGMVYIFKRDSNDKWIEVQRIVADDRDVGDAFGISVSVSGNYLVVGASLEDEDAKGNNQKSGAGSAYIFKYDKSSKKWKQVQKIVASDRDAFDRFGSSVSIKETYLVVGAPFEDHDVNGGNQLTIAGSIYTFKIDNNGKWNFVKKIVPSNRATLSWFGTRVAISSSQTIVVNATGHGLDSSGSNSLAGAGMAYIFERTGNFWNEVKKIQGVTREAQGQVGISVAIQGSLVLVGSRSSYDEKELNFISKAGSVTTYEKNNKGKWVNTKISVAKDRNGTDAFGTAVAIDGENIIIGAPWDDDDFQSKNNVSNAGSVYFYKYSCIQPTKPILSANALSVCKGSSVTIKVTTGSLNDAQDWCWSKDNCDGEVVHKGDSITLSLVLKNVTYYVKAGGGCSKTDTCDTVAIKVKLISTSTNSITICANDSLAVGNKYYQLSGTYKDTLVAQNGCDSFVTTQLTVLPQILNNNNKEVCFGETITVGASTYSATGTYYDTLKAFNSCDSIIKTQLIVNPQNFQTNNIILCQGKKVKVGNNTYASAGSYYDTLQSVSGCDSIIKTNLTIVPYLSAQQNINICYGNSFSIGSSTYTQSGTYSDTLKNTSGCDSIISTILTVLPLNKTKQSFTICKGDFVQVGNNKYTTASTYFDTLQAKNGCDSIVETTVNINNVNTQLTVSKTTINAQAVSATFQWLNCGNNYSLIAGEVSNSYTAQINGDYAVEVTQNSCVDTSTCIAITSVGVGELIDDLGFNIYPNPAKDILNISYNGLIKKWALKNAIGVTILDSETVESNTEKIDVSSLSAGLYVLVLYSEEGTNSIHKVIIR